MVDTFAEVELFVATGTWLAANGYSVEYRITANYPAFNASLDNIEWRGVPPVMPTEQNLIDAYNTYLSDAATQQAKAVARTLMLSDAKNYLSAQLQSSSPNVQTIFNTVKAYVDGNATLSQMVTNQIALFNSAYGVTVNPAGATAADRARYLVCCQLVLATIA